ncbi:MAG: hypothetical protein IPJ26_13465 [Bacteroidetes bacterium]|nr:hypothetical protein [Bacteroidota bacterium]
MDKITIEQEIQNHLGELKNDTRVQNFIAALENHYSQHSIEKILKEKAQKINIYEQSYSLLLELINT